MSDLDKKIKSLEEVAELYEELVKQKPQFHYRLNAIRAEIDVLHEVKRGDLSSNQWLACYMEDKNE